MTATHHSMINETLSRAADRYNRVYRYTQQLKRAICYNVKDNSSNGWIGIIDDSDNKSVVTADEFNGTLSMVLDVIERDDVEDSMEPSMDYVLYDLAAEHEMSRVEIDQHPDAEAIKAFLGVRAKELTVAEISNLLGYDVKVIK